MSITLPSRPPVLRRRQQARQELDGLVDARRRRGRAIPGRGGAWRSVMCSNSREIGRGRRRPRGRVRAPRPRPREPPWRDPAPGPAWRRSGARPARSRRRSGARPRRGARGRRPGRPRPGGPWPWRCASGGGSAAGRSPRPAPRSGAGAAVRAARSLRSRRIAADPDVHVGRAAQDRRAVAGGESPARARAGACASVSRPCAIRMSASVIAPPEHVGEVPGLLEARNAVGDTSDTRRRGPRSSSRRGPAAPRRRPAEMVVLARGGRARGARGPWCRQRRPSIRARAAR